MSRALINHLLLNLLQTILLDHTNDNSNLQLTTVIESVQIFLHLLGTKLTSYIVSNNQSVVGSGEGIFYIIESCEVFHTVSFSLRRLSTAMFRSSSVLMS